MKQNLSDHIAQILSHLPKSPGVYQMKDKDGKVIYVGKAKNLKSRVSSYFDRTTELTLAKRQMVGKINDIETILCETEVEALVLETNLIKHISPKYNILMKDDKNLAYIKITNSPVPEIIKTRQKIRDGGEYYGPFVASVEQCVRAMRRIFRIRNCRMKFAHSNNGNPLITDKAGKTIPCMDYYIGLCPGPCLLTRDALDLHTENIDKARQYLKGKSTEIIESLEREMKEFAKNLEFEKAQEMKETLQNLSLLHERQKVRDILEGDVDIFIKYEKYDKSYIGITQIRASQIIGVFRHEVDIGADDADAIMTTFLMRSYLSDADRPELLLLAEQITDSSLQEFLDHEKYELSIHKFDPKRELIDFTRNQVKEYAYKKELSTLEQRTLTRDHMRHILETLGYSIPKTGEIIFECYDISHTDGHFTYASRVVIKDGKPDTSSYKKYKIKTLEDGMIDDFASHKEVMTRRIREALELGNLPHLIIIDGGKGQLSSALSGIKEVLWDSENQVESKSFDMHEVPLCSIAKTRGRSIPSMKKDPVLFEKGTPELMVLQKARDESHRFSIGANRSARMKSMKKNILDEIPGIGSVTRKNLLKIAGSVHAIRELPLEEIQKITTKSQLQSLIDHGIYPC